MRVRLIALLWVAAAILLCSGFITHRETIGDEWPGFVMLGAFPVLILLYMLRSVARHLGRTLLDVLASSRLLIFGLAASLGGLLLATFCGPHLGPSVLMLTTLLETLLLCVATWRLRKESQIGGGFL